ncbi:MAG: hypothetical protein H0V51_20310 [Chloroflexi bacterium]|nr:hypothetical protein [Chloroflexota bacterium]
MKRLVRALDRFWFTDAPAGRLAVLRILVGGFVFSYLGRRYSMLLRIAGSDPCLFRPVGTAALLDRPMPVKAFRALLGATLVANLAFVLGWRHRYSGPSFAGLLLWVLCYRNSWSMIYHCDNVLALHALILGVTPAADALSLDALVRPSAARQPAGVPDALPRRDPAGDWRYGWPIRLMNGVTVLTYFLAGVAKLAGPLGWKWASGDALRGQVAVDGLRKELLGDGAARLAFALYNNVSLFRTMGLGSLVVELVAPAVLLDKRLSRLWAIGAFLMHWGIFFIMKIKFRYQLAGLIFAPFFDVERLAAWIAPGHVGPRPRR